MQPLQPELHFQLLLYPATFCTVPTVGLMYRVSNIGITQEIDRGSYTAPEINTYTHQKPKSVLNQNRPGETASFVSSGRDRCLKQAIATRMLVELAESSSWSLWPWHATCLRSPQLRLRLVLIIAFFCCEATTVLWGDALAWLAHAAVNDCCCRWRRTPRTSAAAASASHQCYCRYCYHERPLRLLLLLLQLLLY